MQRKKQEGKEGDKNKRPRMDFFRRKKKNKPFDFLNPQVSHTR